MRAGTVGEPRRVLLSSHVVKYAFNTQRRRLWQLRWMQFNNDTQLYQGLPNVLERPADFEPLRQVGFLNTEGRYPPHVYALPLLLSSTSLCRASCLSIDRFISSCTGKTSFRD